MADSWLTALSSLDRTLERVRHPIKAARLLYSSPGWGLRRPIHFIGILLVVALTYSWFGRKDAVVVAPLRLEREATTVEAIGSGMVARVLVTEGQRVNEEQTILLEVQQTRATSTSEKESIQKNLDDLEKQLEQERDEFQHQQGKIALDLEQRRDALKGIVKDRTTLESKLAQTRNDIRAKNVKLDEAQSTLAKQQALLNRKDITRDVFERTKNAVEDLKKGVEDLTAEESRLTLQLTSLSEERIQGDIERLTNELRQGQDRHQTAVERLNSKLALVRRQRTVEETLVAGVGNVGLYTIYRNTFPGLVTQVLVKTGHLVHAGTPLLAIVKDDSRMAARVVVANKDIGRVKLGQPVAIKYFAYPHEEYGVQEGKVSFIATRPTSTQGGAQGATTGAVPPPGQESNFPVQVGGFPKTVSRLGGKSKALEIGLEGVAEIKVGEKRYIEMIFSPLTRLLDPDEAP